MSTPPARATRGPVSSPPARATPGRAARGAAQPRLATLLLALLAAACGPGAPPGAGDGAPGGAAAEAATAAEAAPSVPADGEVEARRGLMTYMADAPTFTDCATGDFFPIAMEGDYLALEHAYLSQRPGPGEPLLVSVAGSFAYRSGMEGDDRVHLVVHRYEDVHPGQGCDEAPAAPALEGVEWTLTHLEGEAVADGVTATLLLEGEGRRATGSGGCNRFTGTYTLAGGSLVFGGVAATRMACPSPALEVEEAYFRLLGMVGSYRTAGSGLELLGEEGPLLRFRTP